MVRCGLSLERRPSPTCYRAKFGRSMSNGT